MENQIRWGRALAEGALVLIGILLAFWIDAWWEGRQEARLQNAIVSAALDEAIQNRTLIGQQLDQARQGQAGVDEFFRMTSGTLPDTTGAVDPRFFRRLAQTRTYEPTLGAAQVLLGSPLEGEHALATRSLLNRWLQGLADAQEYGRLLTAQGDEVRRGLARHALQFVDQGRDDVPRMLVRGGWAAAVAIRADAELSESILVKAQLQDVYIFQTERILPPLDSLIVAMGER